MAQHLQFNAFSQILHWTIAVLVLAILFIGIGMVSSLSDYHWLISIHRPLGILILVLVAIRLANRLLNPAPPLPEAMPGWQRFTAIYIACRPICADVCRAARRLGDAVGGPLSDRTLWAAGTAADPAA